MTKKNIFLFVNLIIISISCLASPIIYDNYSVDPKTNILSVIAHNVYPIQVKDIKISYKDKEYSPISSEKLKNNWLLGIIIDNSGSMKVSDFLTIRSRIDYLIKNIDKDDLVILWKVNDAKKIVSNLSNPSSDYFLRLNKVVRE